MWIDPIVEEIHRIREEYAAQFDYDLERIYQDLKEQEARSGREFVSFAPKRRVVSESPDPEEAVPPSRR
jgi:hypothetical protein